MQFTIKSATPWKQTTGDVTTDYIWCIIKLFGTVDANSLLSMENQPITIPQTTQKNKISTPTVYIPPNIELNPLPFTEDIPAATTTTLPAATTTTLPAATTTTPTQLKYITSAEYDEIIQKYRGNPIYNMNISRLSHDNDSTITKHHPSTTQANVTIIPDDILNYYGNIIMDREGIEIIKQNKYLDDLLNQ
jgi:hypothetical protein